MALSSHDYDSRIEQLRTAHMNIYGENILGLFDYIRSVGGRGSGAYDPIGPPDYDPICPPFVVDGATPSYWWVFLDSSGTGHVVQFECPHCY